MSDVYKQLVGTPINKWEWPRVLGFVPLERSLSYASHVVPWIATLAAKGLAFHWQPYQRVDTARNKAVKAFLQAEEFTHLLMLDVDHLHSMTITEQLCHWVVRDPSIQVVGALNFMGSPPYQPACFLVDDDNVVGTPVEWSKGLLEVGVIGMGSTLIAREVLEQLSEPWFFYRYEQAAAGNYPTEDAGFSKLCRDAGIKMYVDTNSNSPHIRERFITEKDFRDYLAAHREEMLGGQEIYDRAMVTDGNNERIHHPPKIQTTVPAGE